MIAFSQEFFLRSAITFTLNPCRMEKKITADDPCTFKRSGNAPGIVFPGCLVALLILLSSTFSIAQIQLVKDINQIPDWYYNEYRELTDVNGTLYFIVAARELWKTDGTPAGTVPVKKLSGISQLTNWAGTLFFAGDDGLTGTELWKSDGTEAGTVRVKDIQAGNGSSSPHDLTVSGGLLFFIADNGLAGNEVWKSDGTAAGTRLVKDIKAGAGSGNASELTDVNGTLFFSATTGAAGYELWISDGTNTGTKIVRDIYEGSASSLPRKLTNVNGTLFFEATEGVAGRELWKSNGTKGSTVLVKDIRAGSMDSFVYGLTAVNGVVFFVAHDGIHGKELWKSDGTDAGTVLVKDISPGPSAHSGFAFHHIDVLTDVDGTLFFIAYHNNNHDLWRSDGTEAGTFPLTTGSSVEFGFLYPQITAHNGQAYFFAQQSYEEVQFWKSDGTPGGTAPVTESFSFFEYGTEALLEASGNNVFAVGGAWNDRYATQSGYKLYVMNPTATGTTLLLDIVPATISSSPRNMIDVNGTLFFGAGTDNEFEPDLWKSDGTEAGTVQVKDLRDLHDLTEVNEKLFFGGYNDDAVGDELWTSDGTTEGTQIVKNINPDGGSDPRHLTNVNGVLFFNATGPTGRGLWISDGTESGTVRVASMTIPWQWTASPLNHIAFGNQFYFEGYNGASGAGYELWKSDGTPGGTTLVNDINPGAGNSSPHSFTAIGDTLFFVADDGAHGFELWRSDGSGTGTVMVMDIEPGMSSSKPQGLTAFQDALIFTAVTAGSRALWISDGTVAGTTMLQDFYPGEEAISVLESIGNEIFLLVAPSEYSPSLALWKSNGTATGTVKVRDLTTSNTYSSSRAHAVLDGVLYFYAPASRQLWRTDGTACGTYAVGDGQAGEFNVANATLFFSGNVDNALAVGTELYKYEPEPSPCVAASGRSDQMPDQQPTETNAAEDVDAMISSYPNPFGSAFSLTVAGEENGVYQMQVITVNGVSVEPARALKFNTGYTLGSQWGSGIYILKAVVDGKLVTRKLVKTR
jgi:ELWxxDGT repeat protein